jgi:hypothetical protein
VCPRHSLDVMEKKGFAPARHRNPDISAHIAVIIPSLARFNTKNSVFPTEHGHKYLFFMIQTKTAVLSLRNFQCSDFQLTYNVFSVRHEINISIYRR